MLSGMQEQPDELSRLEPLPRYANDERYSQHTGEDYLQKRDTESYTPSKQDKQR